MSIETMLKDEIKDEMEELKKLTPGSEEHKIATDSVTKLYDRVIEMEKEKETVRLIMNLNSSS